jgi:hypothetical protein
MQGWSYWGIVVRTNIPWANEKVIELSPAQAKMVRRTARRYMQAMNRVRRIRQLERSLPRQVCAAFMLNGDLRCLRKKCPEFKMFDHLPAEASAQKQSQRKRVLRREVLGARIGETSTAIASCVCRELISCFEV